MKFIIIKILIVFFLIGLYSCRSEVVSENDDSKSELEAKIGVEYFKLGNYEDAMESARRSLSIKADNITALILLGDVSYIKQNLPDAMNSYKSVLNVDSGRSDASLKLGKIYIELGDYKQALNVLNRAIELDRKDFRLLNEIGQVYLKKGDLKEAIDKYKQAVNVNPDYAIAFNNAGYVYLLLGDYDNALIYLTKSSELKPDYLDSKVNLGNLYYSKKEYKKAINFYKKAVDIFPGAVTNFSLGRAYYEIGNIEKAIESLNNAKERDTLFPYTYYLMAVIYKGQHKYKDAENEAKMAVELAPGNWEAYSTLAELYAIQGKNLKEAEEIVKRSIKMDRKNENHYLASLALVHYKMKKFDLALNEIQRSIDSSPNISSSDLEARSKLLAEIKSVI